MPTISRRKFLAAAATLPYAVQSFAAAAAPSDLVQVYFGTDTDTDDKTSKGVYEALWNPATGKFGTLRLAAKATRPAFLAQSGRFLYVVDEINGPDGTVTAYARKHNGTLHKLNKVTTKGFGPAYISVHPSGRAAYVANYAGGSITSFAILPDGRLTEPVIHLQYAGHGPNAARQAAPHAHSAVVSPDGNFLLINDLGLDQIHIYRIDAGDPSKITENSTWHGTPGAGSRHLAFAPNIAGECTGDCNFTTYAVAFEQGWESHTVYNINEMASTIDTLAWDAKAGTLTTIGSPVSTLPADFKGVSTCAEIAVSSDGRFVYASNRGDDSIAVLSVDPQDSSLTLQQRISTQGKTPRHFTLSPDERWLIAANQDSASVVVFQRDGKSGALTSTGYSITVPHPMQVLFS